MRDRPRDRPFSLSVSFFAAHAEDAAPEQYLPQAWSEGAYAGVTMPPPLRGAPRYPAALPASFDSRRMRGASGSAGDSTRQRDIRTTCGATTGSSPRSTRSSDACVDELRAQGAYDNTLIVFIGDNGYFQGDRGLADKWYPYEESIRVPLIVRDPAPARASRGRAIDAMALNIDLAPTVIAAAGLPVPAAMQGQDLAALYLPGRTRPAWRDEFFYEHPTITSQRPHPVVAGGGAARLEIRRMARVRNEAQFFDLRAIRVSS